jgi:F0F1-type ATP synthase assembly protein I
VTDEGVGKERDAGRSAEAALRDRRELNNGAGDALSVAFELALTPAIFAVAGWRLDLWLGTSPLFLIVLFVFVMAYEFWKLFGRYDARMKVHEETLRAPRRPGGGAP